MAALLQRYKTGRGQHIDCNLLSTQVCALYAITLEESGCKHALRDIKSTVQYRHLISAPVDRTSDLAWLYTHG